MKTKQPKQRKFTAKDFDKRFTDDNACLEYIKNKLYPDGIFCPVCNRITKHHKLAKKPVYECDYCRRQVSPLATTIFRKSSTPLRMWFKSIFWMAATRSGHSAMELQRHTGVTYKTAWRMYKQIRTLLNEKPDMFFGEVEADETYIGGKRHGKRGRGASGKSIVIGIVQRKGSVLASVAPNIRFSTISPIITNNVSKESTLYTDDFPLYDRFTRVGFNHKSINHSAKIYVAGEVHTNNIECFWSLLKRGISGVYHAVSPKYLQSYLNEYAFRYNHRFDETPMFELMLNRIVPQQDV